MNVLDELKDISDNAIAALAARFPDLPRPLLAAIGAGDLAVERLAQLREQVSGKVGDVLPDGIDSMPSGDDLKSFAADLPAKAQKIASDIAEHVSEFAAEAPAKAQRLVNDLPGKAQEFGTALSPEHLKETIEGYTQFLGTVYGSLADRGGATVAQERPEEPAAKPAAKKAPTSKPTSKPASKPAAKKSPAKPAAKKPAAKAADKPAAKKAPAAKTAKAADKSVDTSADQSTAPTATGDN